MDHLFESKNKKTEKFVLNVTKKKQKKKQQREIDPR